MLHVQSVFLLIRSIVVVFYRSRCFHLVFSIRACLDGVGDPGLVGLVSFVFTLYGTQKKSNLPH